MAVACLNTPLPVSLETQYKLLKRIASDPKVTQRTLAQDLGVSVGKVNYCLKGLVDKGWVKLRNFTASEDKRAYLYILTPKGIEQKAKITTDFLRRRVEEYEALECEIRELQQELRDKPVEDQD